jgi:dienelactone hydrolase
VADPVDTLEGTLTDGSAFLYTQNLEAKGLIVAFHGGGGSKEDLLHRRVDAVLIAREAMQRGYSLAALDSVQHLEDNPPNTKWSTVMNIDPTAGEVNPDIVNALEMIDRLRDPQDLAAVSKAAPLIVFGYSNGGTMASRVAQFAPVAVSVTYISNSSAYLEEGAVRPPMVLVPGQNDLDHYATESNTELAAEIEAAGGEVLLIVNPPEAITPGLFQRVPGISCEASRALGQTLADAGWLDSNWMLTANPKSDSSWRDLLSADLAAYKVPISDVLYEARAEHTPSSDWNESVFDFVDANL